MLKCTDIVETKKVIVDFKNETITWKPMMYNPKDSEKFQNIIDRVNKGASYMVSDFE